jgi:hypothetical protein
MKTTSCLFLVNDFENKLNSCSIMDTVVLRVVTKETGIFPSLTLRNILIFSPSSSIYLCLDHFNKHNISLENFFSFRTKFMVPFTLLTCYLYYYTNFQYLILSIIFSSLCISARPIQATCSWQEQEQSNWTELNYCRIITFLNPAEFYLLGCNSI